MSPFRRLCHLPLTEIIFMLLMRCHHCFTDTHQYHLLHTLVTPLNHYHHHWISFPRPSSPLVNVAQQHWVRGHREWSMIYSPLSFAGHQLDNGNTTTVHFIGSSSSTTASYHWSWAVTPYNTGSLRCWDDRWPVIQLMNEFVNVILFSHWALAPSSLRCAYRWGGSRWFTRRHLILFTESHARHDYHYCGHAFDAAATPPGSQ